MLMIVLIYPLQNAQAASFPDVTQYKEEINYLINRGVIKGYEDNTFKPKRNITRLQAITMILREKNITDYSASNPNFVDIKPGDYGYEIVAKAVELGIISGKTNKRGNKYFDSGAPVTRGQMSKILANSYNLRKSKNVNFPDVLPSNGFKDHISALATEGITSGYPDGSFKPNDNLSRQHFAVFMYRIFNKWNGNYISNYFSGNHNGTKLSITDFNETTFRFKIITWSEGWVDDKNGGHWGNYTQKVLEQGIANTNDKNATFKQGSCEIHFNDIPAGIELSISKNCSKFYNAYGEIKVLYNR